jgi:hypothetical protein
MSQPFPLNAPTNPNTEIADALFAHLKTAPLVPMPPISWPNKTFTPTTSATWLRATYLPAEPFTVASFTEGENRYQGLVQFDVFAADGQGLKGGMAIADTIGAHFKRGLTVAAQSFEILISRPPYVLPALKDGAWWGIPVRVYYTADVLNPA